MVQLLIVFRHINRSVFTFPIAGLRKRRAKEVNTSSQDGERRGNATEIPTRITRNLELFPWKHIKDKGEKVKNI